MSGTFNFSFDSSYFLFIVIKQASEYGLTLNGSDLRRQADGDRVIFGVQGPIAQPLMGSQSIVVVNVGLDNVVKMLESKTEEVVEALAFERPDPGLGVAVGDRAAEGRSDGVGFHGFDQPIERSSVFGVSISDDEPHLQRFVFQPHVGVTDLLKHPRLIGVIRAGGDEDLPATQMDEHQAIGYMFAHGRPNSLAEEVGSDDDVSVSFDERPPRGYDTMRRVAFGVRQDPFFFQNASDRSPANRQCQLLELTGDPSCTPSDVLFGQPKDQGPQRSGDLPRPAGPLGYQPDALLSQPSSIGFGRGDTQQVTDPMVQLGSDLHQPASLFGRKDDAIARHVSSEQFDLGHKEPNLHIASTRIGLTNESQERMKPSGRHNEHFFKNSLEGSVRAARHFCPRPSGGSAGQIRYKGRNVLHEAASKRVG